MGWRNGGYASVLLVAVGAAMWGTDAILRVPLLEVASPSQIVLLEHLVLLVYSVPAVVLGWRFFRGLGTAQWVALLIIGWGGSALATLLFTTAFAVGNPTVVILLQKTQPLFAIALAAILLRERLGWAYWPCFAVAMVGAYLISFGDLGPFRALASAEATRRGPRPGRGAAVGLLDRAGTARPERHALPCPDRGAAPPGRAAARRHRGGPGLRRVGSAPASLPSRAGDPPRPDPWPPGPAPVLPGPQRHQGLLRDARGAGLPGNGGRPQLDVPRRRRESRTRSLASSCSGGPCSCSAT